MFSREPAKFEGAKPSLKIHGQRGCFSEQYVPLRVCCQG